MSTLLTDKDPCSTTVLASSGSRSQTPLTRELQHQPLIFSHSWRPQSKIKVWPSLVSSVASLSGLQMAVFLLVSSCGLFWGVSSSSYKDTIPLGSGLLYIGIPGGTLAHPQALLLNIRKVHSRSLSSTQSRGSGERRGEMARQLSIPEALT